MKNELDGILPNIHDPIFLSVVLLKGRSFNEISAQEKKIILDVISSFDYFKDNFMDWNEKGYKKIAQNLSIHYLPEKKVIKQSNEQFDFFYMLAKGEVEVYEPIKDKPESFVKIKKLRRGSCLGHDDLIKKCKSSYKYICLSDCVFLAMEAAQFNFIMNCMETDRIYNFCDFIHDIFPFNELNKTITQKFYKLCQKRKYNKNEIVYSEGSEVDGTYIVLNGEFLMKKMTQIPKNSIEEIEKNINFLRGETNILLGGLNGDIDINSKFYKKILKHLEDQSKEKNTFAKFEDKYELIMANQKGIFGELEIILPDISTRTHSVVCKSDHAEAYFLPKRYLMSYFTKKMENKLTKWVKDKYRNFISKENNNKESSEENILIKAGIIKTTTTTSENKKIKSNKALIDINLENFDQKKSVNRNSINEVPNSLRQLSNSKSISKSDNKLIQIRKDYSNVTLQLPSINAFKYLQTEADAEPKSETKQNTEAEVRNDKNQIVIKKSNKFVNFKLENKAHSHKKEEPQPVQIEKKVESFKFKAYFNSNILSEYKKSTPKRKEIPFSNSQIEKYSINNSRSSIFKSILFILFILETNVANSYTNDIKKLHLKFMKKFQVLSEINPKSITESTVNSNSKKISIKSSNNIREFQQNNKLGFVNSKKAVINQINSENSNSSINENNLDYNVEEYLN